MSDLYVLSIEDISSTDPRILSPLQGIHPGWFLPKVNPVLQPRSVPKPRSSLYEYPITTHAKQHSGSVQLSAEVLLFQVFDYIEQSKSKTSFPSPPIVIGDSMEDLLHDALSDLDEVVTEAAEERFPRPSDGAVLNARRLLIQMYKVAPQRFEVYPTADGEVALDVSNDRGSVILLCDSQGGALCLVNVNGDRRRARYSSTTKLPDGFVREALTELISSS